MTPLRMIGLQMTPTTKGQDDENAGYRVYIDLTNSRHKLARLFETSRLKVLRVPREELRRSEPIDFEPRRFRDNLLARMDRRERCGVSYHKGVCQSLLAALDAELGKKRQVRVRTRVQPVAEAST